MLNQSNGLSSETEGSRVKQKLLELKSRLNQDDLNVKIDKVHKWLSKGYFVNIVIKVAKNSTKKDAEAVKSKIDSAALTWKAEDADILGVKNSKLIITIKWLGIYATYQEIYGECNLETKLECSK